VIAALAATSRVVALDTRGFGWSDGSSEPGLPVRSLGDDLVAAMDDLGVQRAHLAGHDWGGWIGFHAVLEHPQRFTRYTALAVTPPWLDAGAMLRRIIGWGYVVPMAVAGNLIASRAGAVRWMVRHTTRVPVWDGPLGEEALASYSDRVARPSAAAMTRHLYGQLVTKELPAALRARTATLTVPATIVIGEHETISRPELYWPRTRPGELRVEIVDGAGHWLAEERPDAVVAHLRATVDGLVSSPA
jgi:pimeloyl-ACP methyl ester carboxylesterase